MPLFALRPLVCAEKRVLPVHAFKRCGPTPFMHPHSTSAKLNNAPVKGYSAPQAN